MYATCTYNLEENEAVVQGLLEQRPATLQPITLPLPHSLGLLQWKDLYVGRTHAALLAALPRLYRLGGILHGQHSCLSRNTVL